MGRKLFGREKGRYIYRQDSAGRIYRRAWAVLNGCILVAAAANEAG
jgi:hypothetical protein